MESRPPTLPSAPALPWMHDPARWARFYNRASMKTFAALAKELWEGRDPEAAVDAAVDDIARVMAASALPAEVVAAYRDENMRHREHLVELSKEIRELLPEGSAAARPRSHRRPEHHPVDVQLPQLWMAETVARVNLMAVEAAIEALEAWRQSLEMWVRPKGRGPMPLS